MPDVRLTNQEIEAENGRIFDWKGRHPVQLRANIIADHRTQHLFPAILQEAGEIEQNYGELEKVEVIPHKWEMDENFSSILMRWKCMTGTFTRICEVKHVVRSDYSLAAA